MSSIKFNVATLLLALAALGALQLARAGIVSDLLDRHFEGNRLTRCPAPGAEHQFQDKITIKIANFPKEPCQKLCADKGLVSMVGQEQLVFGPKLYCCCKSSDQ